MKIITLRKILLTVPFLISNTGYSMEEDPTKKTILNMTSNTTSMPESPTFVKVTFPAEQEKLQTEITQGSSHIHIHIPYDHRSQDNHETINFQCDLHKLTNIKALIVEHSLGSQRGYAKTAVNALIPVITNAQNLEKITLSQVLADDLLPYLRVGICVFLDFSCSYDSSDTIIPKEYLIELRNNVLAYYQERYPNRLGFQIEALEIQDPFAAFYK